MKLFLISVLFLTPALQAAPPAPVTWQQCLELLKNNNFEYKAAELTYKSTKALELGSESGYYPSLAGSLNYNQSKTTTPIDNFNADAPTSTSYSASLTLSQNLFAGLRDYYKFSEASANTRGAQASFQLVKARITYDFITTYEAFLSAMENIKLTEGIARRRREDLRMIRLRYESGGENKGSVLLSEAYLQQAEFEILQAHHAAELAQTSLTQFLGIPQTLSLLLTDPVPIHESLPIPDFESLATETLEHQQILATIDANIAAVGIARAGFLPSLSLTGSTGRQGNEFFPNQTDRWSIGATLTIPIFDGGKDYSATTSSKFTERSSIAHRVTVDQNAVTNLQQSYHGYIEAIEKLKVDESFQKAALLRSEVARSQYNNGLIRFTDWDQIENDLINRQKSYLQSKKQRVLSEAAWAQAQGQGVLP